MVVHEVKENESHIRRSEEEINNLENLAVEALRSVPYESLGG